MSNEAKIKEFLTKIDDWVDDRNADLVKKHADIDYIINLPSGEVNNMQPRVAASYSFVLFAHAEYLQTLYNKEKSVLDFASSSIWSMVAPVMKNYGSQYSKWEERFYSAVRENPLASKLLKLKISSEARINRLTGKVDTVKKMASILQDIGRSRY